MVVWRPSQLGQEWNLLRNWHSDRHIVRIAVDRIGTFNAASLFAMRQATRATFKLTKDRLASETLDALGQELVTRYVCIEALARKLRSELGPLYDARLSANQLPGDDASSGSDCGAEEDSVDQGEVCIEGAAATAATAATAAESTERCARPSISPPSHATRIDLRDSSSDKQRLIKELEVLLDSIVGVYTALNQGEIDVVSFQAMKGQVL